MDTIKLLLKLIFESAKNNPHITNILVTIGFLVFALYGAMSLASDSDLIFAMYVVLALGAIGLLAFLARR